jgi:hypothetical protein
MFLLATSLTSMMQSIALSFRPFSQHIFKGVRNMDPHLQRLSVLVQQLVSAWQHWRGQRLRPFLQAHCATRRR